MQLCASKRQIASGCVFALEWDQWGAVASSLPTTLLIRAGTRFRLSQAAVSRTQSGVGVGVRVGWGARWETMVSSRMCDSLPDIPPRGLLHPYCITPPICLFHLPIPSSSRTLAPPHADNRHQPSKVSHGGWRRRSSASDEGMTQIQFVKNENDEAHYSDT